MKHKLETNLSDVLWFGYGLSVHPKSFMCSNVGLQKAILGDGGTFKNFEAWAPSAPLVDFGRICEL